MSHKMSLLHFIFDFVNRAQELYTVNSPTNTSSYKNISRLLNPNSNPNSKYLANNFTFNSILPTTVLHVSTQETNYYLFNYYILLITLWLLSNISKNVAIGKIRTPFHVVQFLCEILILNTTLIICLPVIFLFNTIVSTVRYFLRVYFKYFEKGQFLLMKSADAFWAIEEFAQPCNFNSLYVLEGDCCLRTIRRTFQKLVEKKDYERMKRVVVRRFGWYCWEKVENVDIRQHVKYLNGSTSTSILSETQVFDKIREFIDDVFLQDKPPWEVLVVPHYKYDSDSNSEKSGKKYYALIFRMHHAIMDGISAGQIIRNEIADGNCRLSVDPCVPLKISKFQKFGAYFILLTTGVRTLIRSLALMESNCYHRGETLRGPKGIGWSRKIDLNGLKELKNNSGTTTTTILLSALGLGLQNLARKKNLDLPSVIHAGPTVAMLPYPDMKPQNRFILAHLPISIGCKRRLETVREVFKASRNLSGSSALIMNKAMLWLVGRWPVVIMEMFMQLVHATVLVSNVPGFKEPTFLFGGDRLVDAVGWAPIKGTTGIGMCLFSYAGKVRACVVADQVSFPNKSDVQDFLTEFESEIDNLARDLKVPSCIVTNN